MLHPFSHCFLQMDTDKNQQLHHSFFTYACNTLCLPKFPFYFPSILHYTVENYHRRLLSLYGSDQIEQMLTLYGTIILLMTITSTIKKTSHAAGTHSYDDDFLLFFIHTIPVDLLRYYQFSTNTTN